MLPGNTRACQLMQVSDQLKPVASRLAKQATLRIKGSLLWQTTTAKASRAGNQCIFGMSSRSACQNAWMITPEASSALNSPVAFSSAALTPQSPR